MAEETTIGEIIKSYLDRFRVNNTKHLYELKNSEVLYMIAEIEQLTCLKSAYENMSNIAQEYRIERNTLIEEKIKLNFDMADNKSVISDLARQKKELESKLAELDEQEPVATVTQINQEKYFTCLAESYQAKPDIGSRLYSQPKPAEAVQADREALMYLMDRFNNEFWACENCGHEESTKTMDSAYYLRGYLLKNKSQPIDAKPKESDGNVAVVSKGVAYVNAAFIKNGDLVADGDKLYLHSPTTTKPQRITEQDAREIAESYFQYRTSMDDEEASFVSSFFTLWSINEGRTLLAKLNEHREPEKVNIDSKTVEVSEIRMIGNELHNIATALNYSGDGGNEAIADELSKLVTRLWSISKVTANKAEVPPNEWTDRNIIAPEQNQGECILAYDNGFIFECEFDDGIWCSLGGNDFTHWMPRPLPPLKD